MEKRYQVFISSTFQDLQNARQEVSEALLRADCFPAGMELFPAADEEQFEFIKTVIDQSDYYIIISAGRYGSIHPETGMSYTEMEYDYAVEVEKPIIRLLHRDPFNQLKGEHIEKTAKGRKALDKFRSRLQEDRLVKFWASPDELKAETLLALQDIQRRRPAVGWIKAPSRDIEDTQMELERTRRELAELKLQHAHSAPDFASMLQSISGTVLIEAVEIVETKYDQSMRRQVPVKGRRFQEKIALRDLAIRVCVGALRTDSLFSLEQRVFERTEKKSGFSEELESQFLGDFNFLRFVQRLEAVGLLCSEANQGIHGFGGQIWFLEDHTRRWISQFAAEDNYI